MNAVRRAFPIRALAAIHVGAAISTALARAGSLPNPTEWRTGDRGIVHEEVQRHSDSPDLARVSHRP